MGNASPMNHSRNSIRVERRFDLNEFDLGEIYCIQKKQLYKTCMAPNHIIVTQKIIRTYHFCGIAFLIGSDPT